MIQVKPFVIANAGTTKYLCLQNVRLGYGIPAHYLTATKAWNGTEQHRDRNFPAGCDVPVFYSWTGTVDGVKDNYGHIAVRLADGRVWSDGKYFANVDALIGSYLSNGSYLGWGESVNNVKVIKEASMAEVINDDVSRQVGYHLLGRNGFDGRPNALQAKQTDIAGKPLTNAQHSTFFLSEESRNWRDKTLPALYTERDTLRTTVTAKNTQIANMQKVIDNQKIEIDKVTQALNAKQVEIDTLQDEVTLQRAEIEAQNKKIEDLEAQLAAGGGTSEDTTMLDKLKEGINWFIKRIFK
jgi:hypothetical protein